MTQPENEIVDADLRLRMIASAESWERAATTARLAGRHEYAESLEERARRWRHLAAEELPR